MKKLRMKDTDLTLSRMALGTDHFGDRTDRKEAFRILDTFRDMGGNFLDTANVYGKWLPDGVNHSERILGRWLKETGARDMVVATKGGHFDLAKPGISRVTAKEIRTDLEESLGSLGLERIDFYWLHRDNPAMGMEELVDIMEELVKEGKIRYYGASNFCSERLEEARVYAKKKGAQGFSAVSDQWSLATENLPKELGAAASATDPTMIRTDGKLYEWHVKTGTPLVPYTSSARGYFGKLEAGTVSEALAKKYDNSRNRELYRLLREESGRCGLGAYGLGQAFLLAQPFQVYPVTSVSSPEQMAEFQAICEYEMPAELAEKLLRIKMDCQEETSVF